jgi:nucleoside-diphosphate-sugar epimerase
VQAALRGMTFDAVVDWIAYTPDDVTRDNRALFRGVTRQYHLHQLGVGRTRSRPRNPSSPNPTPLHNPYWKYSQNKIACEERLQQAYREEGFPAVIVRPSLTYSTVFPIAIGGWGCYTLADRLLKGQPIIVHGDGSSLWTVTHAADFAKGFVGLLATRSRLGTPSTSRPDEVLTWIKSTRHRHALGVEANIVPSLRISSQDQPAAGAGCSSTRRGASSSTTPKSKRSCRRSSTIPSARASRRTLAWSTRTTPQAGG